MLMEAEENCRSPNMKKPGRHRISSMSSSREMECRFTSNLT